MTMLPGFARRRLDRREFTSGGASSRWQWTKISHTIDAIGRTAFSNWKQWLDGGMEPAGDDVQHVYDQQGRMVQNYDGTSTYGTNWRWAGAANSHTGPMYGPAADTSSQDNHNIGAASFKGIPLRRSFTQPTTEGDKRELFGQGRPMAKDSVSAWNTGVSSDVQHASQSVAKSRFSFIGTVAATDMSRATDSREAGRIGIFGSALSYGGSYGRVTNEPIGRDVNPLGRGGGYALVGGMQNLGHLSPSLAGTLVEGGFKGNSVNNACCGGSSGGGRGGGGFLPLPGDSDWEPDQWYSGGRDKNPKLFGSDVARLGPCSDKSNEPCQISYGDPYYETSCRFAGANFNMPTPREFCLFNLGQYNPGSSNPTPWGKVFKVCAGNGGCLGETTMDVLLLALGSLPGALARAGTNMSSEGRILSSARDIWGNYIGPAKLLEIIRNSDTMGELFTGILDLIYDLLGNPQSVLEIAAILMNVALNIFLAVAGRFGAGTIYLALATALLKFAACLGCCAANSAWAAQIYNEGSCTTSKGIETWPTI